MMHEYEPLNYIKYNDESPILASVEPVLVDSNNKDKQCVGSRDGVIIQSEDQKTDEGTSDYHHNDSDEVFSNNEQDSITNKVFWLLNSNKKIIFSIIGLFFVAITFFYFVFWKAPSNAPTKAYVIIKNGETLSQVAQKLYSNKIIKSEFWFKAFASVFAMSTKGVRAGDYRLSDQENVLSLSWRIVNSDYDLVPIKILIPEGTSVREIADIFSVALPKFDKRKFIMLASSDEGYLFPDTYSFMPNTKEEDIVKIMKQTFESRIKSIENQIKSFGKPLRDIIIMASIVEEEARTMDTRRTIAGILWKRLEISMPLQVDAVFPYINGKNTYQLTTEDLREDSPYNTYTRVGLPPGAITNPGLDSIIATISPIKSKYFYYLSDKKGEMYYAVTHDEHVFNKGKYLR